MDEWPYRLRLTYDAVVVFSQAVLRLKNSGTARFPLERVVCHSPDSYEVSPLDAAIKAVNFEGLSGEIAFNEHGDRVNYTVNIYMGKGTTVYTHNAIEEIKPLGQWTQNIKHWESKYGRQWPSEKRLYMGPFRNAEVDTIKIVSPEEPPYLFDDSRVGLQGFIPVFLKNLKRIMEDELGHVFTYELELASEGDYGRYDIVS